MKQHPITNYLSVLLIITIVLAFAVLALFLVFPKHYLSPMIPYTMFLSCVITSASYVWIYYAKQKHGDNLVQILVWNKMTKLILYAIGFVVLFFLNEGDKIPFAVQFMLFYVFYMTYDTIGLHHLLRKK